MKIEDVPTDQIIVSRYNIRKRLEEAGLESLAKSIEENGLLQPIIVSKKSDGQYELIAGQRRFVTCFKKLNWEKIPAVIIENAEDKEILTISTVENLQREDLNIIYKSDAILKLYEMYDENINDVVVATGYTKQTINKYFFVKDLQEEVRQDIIEENRKISLDVVIALIKNKNIQKEEHQKILDSTGSKNKKDTIKRINRITGSSSKQDVYDSSKGKQRIKQFALKVLNHRYQLISEDFDHLMKIQEELIIRFNKINTVNPLFKIIFENPHVIENFRRISRHSDSKDFFEIKLQRFDYRQRELLDILYADLRKNYKEFDNEIKELLLEDMKELSKMEIFEEQIQRISDLLRREIL